MRRHQVLLDDFNRISLEKFSVDSTQQRRLGMLKVLNFNRLPLLTPTVKTIVSPTTASEPQLRTNFSERLSRTTEVRQRNGGTGSYPVPYLSEKGCLWSGFAACLEPAGDAVHGLLRDACHWRLLMRIWEGRFRRPWDLGRHRPV